MFVSGIIIIVWMPKGIYHCVFCFYNPIWIISTCVFLYFLEHSKQWCYFKFFFFQIYDLQMDPRWFLTHSGCFLTSSASGFHAALDQMRFITQKSVLLLGAWWFPAWLFAVKNIFNFQFPPQSIRNMGLTSLDTIYDINIVEMQTQRMIFKSKLRPLVVGCRTVFGKSTMRQWV